MDPGLLTLLGVLAAVPSPAAGTMPYAMARRAAVPGYVVRIPLPAARRAVPLPEIAGPRDPRLPLIVIDAGHGGFDGGADEAGPAEKVRALALAKTLRDDLVATARFRVALTREGDIFLPLEERAAIARRLGADLFVSLHADDDAAGARVYTLAAGPSAPTAERLARRENTVAQPAVTRTGRAGANLAGLTDQQIVDRSAMFARLIVREGKWSAGYASDPLGAAGFEVLRPLGTPAVLFAAGRGDIEGRRAGFAAAMTRAVRIYFNRLPPER